MEDTRREQRMQAVRDPVEERRTITDTSKDMSRP